MSLCLTRETRRLARTSRSARSSRASRGSASTAQSPYGATKRAQWRSSRGMGAFRRLRSSVLTFLPAVTPDHLASYQRRACTHVHDQPTMNTGLDLETLSFDLDELDFDFEDFGFSLDAGFRGSERDGAELSTDGRASNEDCEAFAGKFEPKLTADDCHTPDYAHKAVREWACDAYGIDQGKCVRPFSPAAISRILTIPKAVRLSTILRSLSWRGSSISMKNEESSIFFLHLSLRFSAGTVRATAYAQA